MIRLGAPKQPRWLELGSGVRVYVKPLTTAVYKSAELTAVRNASEVAAKDGLIERAGGSIWNIPDLSKRDGLLGLQAQYMLQLLAEHAVMEWEGVELENGKPAPITPEYISSLIRDHPRQCIRFESQYLSELIETDAEGNDSSTSQNGTLAAVQPTADGAESLINPAAEESQPQTENVVRT